MKQITVNELMSIIAPETISGSIDRMIEICNTQARHYTKMAKQEYNHEAIIEQYNYYKGIKDAIDVLITELGIANNYNCFLIHDGNKHEIVMNGKRG